MVLLLQLVETTEKIAEVLPELNVLVAVLLIALTAPVLLVLIFAMLIRYLLVDVANTMRTELGELVERIGELNGKLGEFLERERLERIIRPGAGD